jgi:hypothetical protein
VGRRGRISKRRNEGTKERSVEKYRRNVFFFGRSPLPQQNEKRGLQVKKQKKTKEKKRKQKKRKRTKTKQTKTKQIKTNQNKSKEKKRRKRKEKKK